MLSKETFAKAMAGLGSIWKEIQAVNDDEFSSDFWYRTLRDLDEESFKNAIVVIVKTSHFPPKPADIREAAVASIPKLEASDAWAMVLQDIRKGNFYWGKPDYPDWKVNKALESFSCNELREMTSQNISILRAQFIRIYEGLQEREHKTLVVNDPKVKALLETIVPKLKGVD